MKASALDEGRLWLPLSYQTLFLKLKDAAQIAESLERCTTVLEGTIDLEQSTKAHPIFRIRCRQENGKTYSEMVDGLTNKTLTTPVVLDVGPTGGGLSLAEERRRLAEKHSRIEVLWKMCLDVYRRKTKSMINLQGLEAEGAPIPTRYEEEQVDFSFDFNAEDIVGTSLKFRANCQVSDEKVLSFKLEKRPEIAN